MRLKLIALTVFVLGLGLFINSTMNRHKSKSHSPRSFVVQYLVSRSEGDAPLKPSEYTVRAVSSTGEWKETRYYFDGRTKTWGATNDGLFIIASGSRQYFGNSSLEFTRNGLRSEEAFKTNSSLLREEMLLGLKAYVLTDRNNPMMDFEVSYSTETGPTPLTSVIRSKPGSEKPFTEIREAVKIDFRDLSQDEFSLPDLPIRYEAAEDKVTALRTHGQEDRAREIEESMNKLRGLAK